MRRALFILIASLVLLSTAAMGCRTVFASPADDPPAASPSDTSPPSDSAYFDRIAVIPIDVEIPYFYQQVLNVAGMYIFSTPDGNVHKRIYGSLNGVYGWYIPVGPEHIVSADAEPIDTDDDVRFYEEAVAAYKAENPENQQFTGILPPEDGTYQLTELLGYSVSDLFRYSLMGVGGFCLLIMFGFGIKKLTGRRRKR